MTGGAPRQEAATVLTRYLLAIRPEPHRASLVGADPLYPGSAPPATVSIVRPACKRQELFGWHPPVRVDGTTRDDSPLVQQV